jgi:glycosyltransferase involved in cell wall biosynthesis
MSSAPKACLVGTAPPRRCGIATFTDDLRAALTTAHPDVPAVQVALTDVGGAYDYGPDVVFEVQAPQRSDYRTAAAFLNASDVDVLCVQHEFGIFGGPLGRHVDELLDHVQAPVVTTLHTVLAHPSPELREATRRLAQRSDALVVLADRAVELLVEGCGIDPALVHVIPHGVPEAPQLDQDRAKESLGLAGRTVLLTFGLLGPDKGVEVALEALPAVVADDPSVPLRRGRRDPPARAARPRRRLPGVAAGDGGGAGPAGPRAVRRPLPRPRGAVPVPRGERRVRDAVPQHGADRVGHARLRGRHGVRGRLDALPVRPGAAGGRPRPAVPLRRPGPRWARACATCSPTSRRGPGCADAPASTGRR